LNDVTVPENVLFFFEYNEESGKGKADIADGKMSQYCPIGIDMKGGTPADSR
jgi:hypothetical protein